MIINIIKNKKTIAFLLVIAAIFVIGGGVAALNGWFGSGANPQIVEDTMTRGLVGYWSFDEGAGQTAYDASGNGNNGILGSSASADASDPKWTGDVSSSATLRPKSGALQFDGVNDYVEVPDSPSLAITDKIAIEAWVKINNLNGSPQIVSKVGGGYQLQFQFRGDSGKGLNIYFHNGTNADSLWSQSNVITDSNWHHIVVTRDSSAVKFYVDGISVGTATAQYSVANPIASVLIGTLGAVDWFNGSIDEVRIYNRALSAEEIRFHYNRGAPVAQWKFDEGSGTKAYDSTTNNNDGTLNLGSGGNTTVANAWVQGKYGSAISFDGTDDYVNAGQGASLNITNAITLEAWVKPDETFSSRLGEGYTVKYEANELPENASPAWSKRGSDPASVSNGILNIVDTKADELRDYYHYPWGMVRATGATVLTRVRVNSTNNDFCPVGFYLVDDVNWATICFAIGITRIYDGAAGEVTYSVNNSEFQSYRITYKNGIVNVYLNENPTPILTDTITTTYGANAIQFGSSFAYSYTSNSDWDYVYYDLTGAYAPNDESYLAFNIASKGEDAYAFEIRSGKLYGFINNGSISTSIDTNWHHIVQTYDGSQHKLYVDGMLKVSRALTGSINTNVNNFILGDNFNGTIDDVRIYNYARTPDEIRLDYNAGFAAKFGPQSSCEEDPGSCMTKGLVGYWGMDEGTGQTAYDSSGSGNNGTLGASSAVGADDPKWTSGAPRPSVASGGGGLQFDGSNDYVNAGSGSSLSISQNITVSLWLYLRSFGTGYGSDAIDRGCYGPTIWIAPTHGNKIAWLKQCVSAATVDSTFSPQLNRWYHVVGTYDGSVFRLYFDGKLDATRSYSTTFTSSDVVKIGYGGDGYFDGLIDEVRIYNRALSAEEIRYHYNRGGPVAQWKFNEGSGSKAYDSTTNNNGALNLGSGGNTTVANAWVQGKYGSAISFDGTDDYVDAGNPSILRLTTFALESWIKINSYPTELVGNIVSKGASYDDVSGNNVNYGLGIAGTGSIPYGGTVGTVAFGFEDSSGVDHGIVSTEIIPLNKWTHLVGIYDYSTGYYSIYIDGKEAIKTKNATCMQAPGNPPYSCTGGLPETNEQKVGIGAQIQPTGNRTNHFNGLIDDVRIYNYARTADEIRLDYNAGFAARFGPQTDCNTGPGSCMTKGLVGYWSMDQGAGQTAYDASGSGNNGTLGASSAAGTDDPKWTTGKSGGGLQFDGVNDYVDSGDVPGASNTDKYVLETWFNPATLSGWKPIIGASQMRNQIHIENATLQFSINDGTYWYILQATLPSANIWYHVVAVNDRSTNRLELYLNGVLKSSNTGVKNSTIYTSAMGIGRGQIYDGAWVTKYFNGLIDEVRIYNRALSAEEIRYHYNRGAPVAQWKFDEGSGQKAFDNSDNNNDGWLGGTSAVESSDPTWAVGKFGSALQFDGTDDYVNAGNGASLNITSAITIEAWAKTSVSDSTIDTIVSKFSSSPYNGWFIRRDPNGTIVKFGLYNNGTTMAYLESPAIEANKWAHYVGTFDGTVAKFYVNGVLSGTDPNASIGVSSSSVIIGGNYGGASEPWNGTIDDVRIYNYARTASEILVDYNAGLAAHLR